MLGALKEMFRFMQVYRKFWMAPILIGLFLVGSLLILAQSSAIAPFIYALF